MTELEAHLAHAQRPLPEILPEWQGFFAACREQRLEIEQCAVCGARQFYPRGQCTTCGGAVAPLVCSGRGTIYSHTTIRMNRTPGFKDLTPFHLAVIELDEGVRMTGPVFGTSPAIGASVEARFAELAVSGIWVAAWVLVPPAEDTR